MAKKIIFKINIQSISDIITNSSSETFVINGTGIPKEILQKELETVNRSFPRWHEVYKDYCDFLQLSQEEKNKFEIASGDGGTLEVKSWEDLYEDWIKDYIPENKRSLVSPEIWALHHEESLEELKNQLMITIDEGFQNTIKYFIENYEIYEKNCWNFVTGEKDPETGRILRVLSWKEWDKLPEERKAFGNNY
jgi:hypothetical protein